MGVVAAAARELMAVGVTGDDLIAALDRIVDAMPPQITARQARNQRAYQARKQRPVTGAQATETDLKRLNSGASAPASRAETPTSTSELLLPGNYQNPSPEGGEGQKVIKNSEAGLDRRMVNRGIRIPDGFPDAEAMRWAIAEGGLSPAAAANEAPKFRDYWIGKAGKDATKLDWPATWRNWCRRSHEHQRGPPMATGKGERVSGVAKVWAEEMGWLNDDGTLDVAKFEGRSGRREAESVGASVIDLEADAELFPPSDRT